MKKHDTITRIEEVSEHKLTEICCNKCGKSSKIHYDGEYEADFSLNEYQEFNLSFDYGSRFDSERWNFDLCEDCLVDLIKTFKFSPSGFGQENYRAYDEQLTFEKWKETGELDLETGMTKEEIASRGGSIYGDDDENDRSNSLCCHRPMILNHRINNKGVREFGYYCPKCGHMEWDLED